MKKRILAIIALFVFINPVSAWDWNTHESIVESLYYSSSQELQRELDLDLMKQGSIAPDKDFRDNVLHHFPPSYNKTMYWLNQTNFYILNGDYSNASYCFGIATHYISDSYVAPHSISGEDPKLHSKFEKSPIPISTNCLNGDFDLFKELNASQKNSEDWKIWLKNQTKEIPQEELEQAMELIYPLFLQTFNTTCETRTTKIEKIPIQIGEKTKGYLFFLLIFFLINIRSKYFSKLIGH